MMNNMWKKTLAGITIMAMLLSGAAGCGEQKSVSTTPVAETSAEETQEETSAETTQEETTAKEESSEESSSSTKIEAQAVSASYSAYSGGILETEDVFTDRDLLQTPDLSEAQYLTASDGETLSITEAGIYVISGSAEDCTIRVEAADDAKVQLVLDGVSITNADFPAIYVVSADKCFVTTTDSENSLNVTGSFTSDGDTSTDAVIFSKDDLVLSGTGSLEITSNYGNGISCKDDLKITGGAYTITSAEDAVEANDSIAVCGGDFTIAADKDGLHCENDEDNSVGWIWIAGGSFNITAGSDGIQATTGLQIDDGQITVSASEGLEATYVQVNGGTVDISASDDGINATSKSSYMDVVAEFNGGEITIVMGQGDTDAVDSNGSIYVNGGTLDITAYTSSFDYDYTAQLNGGTVIINGSQVSEIPAGMMGGGMGFGGGMTGGSGFGGESFSGHGRHM
ncbi:MAG TPA: carbohydrate-binding domain-containing protein [Ruminococcus sp.]|nr:carbohydrate-binding domain-containing protein [Ruminococcus sp.]